MKLSARINAFSRLGNELGKMSLPERMGLAETVRNENPWFVEDSVLLAIKGVVELLDEGRLNSWAQSYYPEPILPRTIGVAMAGNIPMVGFHDLLCVLMSGHRLKAKLSSQDSVLVKSLVSRLVEIEPRFQDQVSFAENLKEVDAIIATGSDNTSRYFEYYFRKIPHLIRKNRSSCAVILGEESKEEFGLLGQDVFSYFGLGCRNVSKLYVPGEFDFEPLLAAWEPYQQLINNNKYANNYDYQKAIMHLNKEQFHDGGFVILKENHQFVSPVSTVYFEKYHDQQEVHEKLQQVESKLQVIVSARGWFTGSLPFGKAQFPDVGDYADQVDTMKFLLAIK